MNYGKSIKELSWEIYLKSMNASEVEEKLKQVFEMGKRAGKMEMNGTSDVKIDTVNPFNH